jgi:hypothetical protein
MLFLFIKEDIILRLITRWNIRKKIWKKICSSGLKLPSFRAYTEKRSTNHENLLALTKPEFGQEIVNEEPSLSSTQN